MQEMNGAKTNGLMLVGIGASAGGIDALLNFFERLPNDTGMAFAVVLHTGPDHNSRLAEVLQTKTGMPVVPVTDTASIEPNQVYCLPPNKTVEIVDSHFRLVETDMTTDHHAPIDLFFRMLAYAYKDKSIAVVLSGAGADGSLGLGRVREEGGVSIAQDPNEAEHASMPRSAIETGFVDFILPVGMMADKLVSLKQNAERIQLPPTIKQPPRSFEEDSLRELLALLRARTRHDFSNYKRSTLLRRIERRLQVTESEDVPAYLEYIRRHPDELQGLLRDLLISVTNFFRDPEAFRRLGAEVVPKLFERKSAGEQIRVWVAGCATGEEAYSVAMLLAEHAEMLSTPPGLQVFATDIDEQALAHGRAGLYQSTIAADVSQERLKRFFLKEGLYYRVRRELREMVLFAPHNILRDPPFSKLDLVSCRNLLIYINRTMQERILEVFHFALKPDGYLFLGSSESAEGPSELFKPAHKKYRIFQRHEDGRVGFKLTPTPPVAGEWIARPAVLQPMPPTGARPDSFSYGELHYRMLEAFAPPSVLVNSDYDIVHLSEHAGRFLHLGGGEPTRNLLKVAHPDLRLELRSQLITAAHDGRPAQSRVLVHLEGGPKLVNITARPLDAPQATAGFLLVTFEELDEAAPSESEGRGESDVAPAAATAAPSVNALEPIVLQLEIELERTRDQLRATIEEYETSTEELRASNEELQAMNEELRSASEELETGKEELQSVNEELSTLNMELREKVDEIGRSNSDLQNLMASTRLATLFLDRRLRLKRYTPSAQELFNVIPGDIGRPLAHITNKLDYPALGDDADRVLHDLLTVEREVRSRDGRYFLARLLPYRATDDKINGVVLTFTDIHERKLAEEVVARDLRGTQILRELATKSVADGEPQALYDQILDAAVALTDADAGTIQLLDEPTQQLVLLAAKNIPPHMIERFARVDANSHTSCGAALTKGERVFVDYDAPNLPDPDGELRMHADAGFISAQSTPLVARTGKPIGMFTTHWSTRRRATEHELRYLDLLARQAADLIEQRRVEEARRSSEEHFRALIEASSDVIYRMSADWDEMRYLEGKDFVPDTKSPNNNWLDKYIPAEDRPRVLSVVREAVRAKSIFELEHRVIRADGAIGWTFSRAVPLLDGRGEVVEWFGAASDTTERKRAEQAVHESEEKYRTLFDSMDEGFCIIEVLFDRDGEAFDYRFLETNPAFVKQTGIVDAVGKRMLELAPQHEIFWVKTYGEIARTGAARRFEHQAQALNRWFDVYAFPIGEPEERRIAVVFNDIRERRRAEAALRDSEARFHSVANLVPDLLWESEPDGSPNWYNHRWLEYTGQSFEQAVGRDWAEAIHPDDREESARRYREAVAKGEPLRQEHRIRRHDGEYRWFVVNVFPLKGEGGRVVRMYGAATDIHEQRTALELLRASEERLRLVVESAEDYAIMLMDARGRYVSWNAGAEKMFGYKEEEVIGQPTTIIFTPEDRAAGLPEQELRTAEQTGRASDERWHMRKDGTRFYVSGVVVGLHHGRGFAKIARDLTTQKRAQDDLQHAWEGLEKRIAERTAELAEANSAMREEVAVRRRAEHERLELLRRVVSTQEDERRRISRELHDQLGQSLTALRLKLEGLKTDAGRRSKLQSPIAELSEIAQKLDKDVDFLAWELRPTALDDLGLIVALSNYAQEWARHYGVKVNFHSAGLGDGRLAPLVETSLYRITQEALNNVSKHAAATNVDLLLERRDSHVVLIIEDNGQGFNAEAAQASDGTPAMGLIGMRERAALVNGEVEVESQPGEGTTVFVRVPAKLTPAGTDDGGK